ncbi:hypothetical protein EDC65_4792 [Stella humosa]|uniref:Uncharacterized protein n=1 Tax=Stella humosa TaxID=94 RepID=A0A3N1KWV8_9PROT|nr:hypothetical protein [Stella humosa]ROP83259.1 hypothetical protein EDC65_4792 [Stella humosa]BBK29959.1 hypothetical protein STHU_05930 [Stella humosa]
MSDASASEFVYNPFPVTALLQGGQADAVAAQIAMLRAQQRRPVAIWVVQPDHDPAVVALADPAGRPQVQILRSDRPLASWAPLVFAWFLPTLYGMFVAPGAALDRRFLYSAGNCLLGHRALICAGGTRQGVPVEPGEEPAAIDAGSGAWVFETSWIRHAWRRPPAGLPGDTMAKFEAGLRQSGTPMLVPPLLPGATAHLLA